jgi:hypothetical protein
MGRNRAQTWAPNSRTAWKTRLRLKSAALNNQLRKGAWLQRSFTLSTVNRLSFFLPPSSFLILTFLMALYERRIKREAKLAV